MGPPLYLLETEKYLSLINLRSYPSHIDRVIQLKIPKNRLLNLKSLSTQKVYSTDSANVISIGFYSNNEFYYSPT